MGLCKVSTAHDYSDIKEETNRSVEVWKFARGEKMHLHALGYYEAVPSSPVYNQLAAEC